MEKMLTTATPLVDRIIVLGKGNSASLPYLDLPVINLCPKSSREFTEAAAEAVTKKSLTSSIESLTSVDASKFLTSSMTVNDHTTPERPA